MFCALGKSISKPPLWYILFVIVVKAIAPNNSAKAAFVYPTFKKLFTVF